MSLSRSWKVAVFSLLAVPTVLVAQTTSKPAPAAATLAPKPVGALWFDPVQPFPKELNMITSGRAITWTGVSSALAPTALTYSRLELGLERVDESATLWFNGQEIQNLGISAEAAPIDVTNRLMPGENTFRVLVMNGPGGCGAVVRMRTNQDNNKVRAWEWRKAWNPSGQCVDETISVWNFPTPPAGFHTVELKLNAVDDVMTVWMDSGPYKGHALDSTFMQYSKPFKDVSKHFVPGDNYIRVKIDNPAGGPCGGNMQMLIDGALYAPPNWTWRHYDNRPSEYPCFDVQTLVHIE
jgi:hypothetical protein